MGDSFWPGATLFATAIIVGALLDWRAPGKPWKRAWATLMLPRDERRAVKRAVRTGQAMDDPRLAYAGVVCARSREATAIKQLRNLLVVVPLFVAGLVLTQSHPTELWLWVLLGVFVALEATSLVYWTHTRRAAARSLAATAERFGPPPSAPYLPPPSAPPIPGDGAVS